MKINKLKCPDIGQNGFHKNVLTKERIGTLFIYPINYTPKDCLSCDGYQLNILDYEDLYNIIGTSFNKSTDPPETFRIPDYNVTGRFLQPGNNAGDLLSAGLPNIIGGFGAAYFYNERVGNRFFTGAFTQGSTWSTTRAIGNGGSDSQAYVNFNASIANPIYGNSDTVQPSSQLVHICIKFR